MRHMPFKSAFWEAAFSLFEYFKYGPHLYWDMGGPWSAGGPGGGGTHLLGGKALSVHSINN